MNIHCKLICNLNLIKRDITINSVTDPDPLISSLAWEGGKGGKEKKYFGACAKVPRFSLTASLLSKNRISFSIKGTTPTVNFPVLAYGFRATVLAPNRICWRLSYIPPPLAAVGPKLFSGKFQKEVAMFVVFGSWIMCRVSPTFSSVGESARTLGTKLCHL